MILKKPLLFINNRGQSLILTVIFGSLFMGLAMANLKFSRFIERKIALQNGTDAALLSGSALLAEGLNRISKLNLRLIQLHKWLLLVRAGKIVTGNAGLQLTEEGLKKMIQLTALEQDVIKWTFPLKASTRAMIIAKKHETPHLILSPFMISYALEREPDRMGLPAPYVLLDDHEEKHQWKGKNFYYEGAYQAVGRTALIGEDLLTPTWKGVLIE